MQYGSCFDNVNVIEAIKSCLRMERTLLGFSKHKTTPILMKTEILNRLRELGACVTDGNSLKDVIEGIEFNHPLYPHELWGHELYGIDEYQVIA